MVELPEVRRVALALPRATENLVREYTKFRVGRIVFASVSPDEQRLGVGFDRRLREAMVQAEPDKFLLPGRGDLRYNWIVVRMPALDRVELAELLLEAWQLVVSARTAHDFLTGLPSGWTRSVYEHDQ